MGDCSTVGWTDADDAWDCFHFGLTREPASAWTPENRKELGLGFIRRLEQILTLEDVNVARAAGGRTTRKRYRGVMGVAEIDESAASFDVDSLRSAGAALQKLDPGHRRLF